MFGLETERRTPNAPHGLASLGTRGQGDAFSGLPRFPALRRLVRPLLRVYRDTSPYERTGTRNGVMFLCYFPERWRYLWSCTRKGLSFRRGYLLHGGPERYA